MIGALSRCNAARLPQVIRDYRRSENSGWITPSGSMNERMVALAFSHVPTEMSSRMTQAMLDCGFVDKSGIMKAFLKSGKRRPDILDDLVTMGEFGIQIWYSNTA